MSNPISSVHNNRTEEAARPAPARPQPPPPQTQKSGELSQDKVTLRNAGDTGRDGQQ